MRRAASVLASRQWWPVCWLEGVGSAQWRGFVGIPQFLFGRMPELFFTTFGFTSLLPKLMSTDSDFLVCWLCHAALRWQGRPRSGRGFGSGAVRPCYPLGWPRRQCGGAYTVPGNKLVRESAGGHNLRGARASLLTCQLYDASLEPRPAASLRTGLFFIVLRGITSLISDSQSERLDEYPEVKAKLTAQLRENHEQLKRLEQCLEGCGESTKQCRLGAVGGKPVRL
jgi:hypothetical protein